MGLVELRTLNPASAGRVAGLALASALALAACGTSDSGEAALDQTASETSSGITASTDAAAGSDTTADASPDTSAATTESTGETTETTSTDDATTETTPTDTTAPPQESTEPQGSPLDGLTVAVDDTVRFTAGDSSGTVSGAVIRGERDVYRFGAQAGQQLNLVITSLEDNGVVDVFDPTGAKIVDEVAQAEVNLPTDGEYLVVVGGTRGNVTYDLTLSIPA